ncbi:MAG: helix-turn-helix transcriptional regulator [Eubacteriales bacterium]|nr:helix-turn-helix transcriptional regulator [Eubacteriales bacterium]MDD4421488.1 helix-turn-helix transcriptional regulator [Eubacteriales bacterium]
MKLNIGVNIRKYRKKADMTQEQLADRLGTTDQSVSRWENGSTYPDMELLPVIAELFGVTTDALLGMPEREKEKKAIDAIDMLSREAMKPEIDPAIVIPLIRDIKNNYLGCSCAWRLWVESNNRCYRHPEVLPEVRLMADAYREKTSFIESSFCIKTMALVESEEFIDEFFKKYTTTLDSSERELRFARYFELRNSEKFEPERRVKFYMTICTLLNTRTLIGWSDKESDLKRAVTFQAELLDLIRDNRNDDELDMWISRRLMLGFDNATCLAASGDVNGAVMLIGKNVCLLEKTMKITDKCILGCSCSWLDGMVCEASEDYTNSRINPDEDEERFIKISIRIGQLVLCNNVYPSFYYKTLTDFGNNNTLQENPQFSILTERVKALIVTRPKSK